MNGSLCGMKLVVRCANLEASRSFYTGVLGLPVVEQWDEPQGRGIIMAVGDPAAGASIEMYEMTPADSRYDPRFREAVANDKVDLQLRTDSVDDWAWRLDGRWPFEGPEDLPWGHRWIRLRDPDGLLIAIYAPA